MLQNTFTKGVLYIWYILFNINSSSIHHYNIYCLGGALRLLLPDIVYCPLCDSHSPKGRTIRFVWVWMICVDGVLSRRVDDSFGKFLLLSLVLCLQEGYIMFTPTSQSLMICSYVDVPECYDLKLNQ